MSEEMGVQHPRGAGGCRPVSDLRAALDDWNESGDDCYQCNSDVRGAARALLAALPEIQRQDQQQAMQRGYNMACRVAKMCPECSEPIKAQDWTVEVGSERLVHTECADKSGGPTP